ncbi:MAG: hypothetical protein AABX70_02865 [Nanoarchaeota archaeon]
MTILIPTFQEGKEFERLETNGVPAALEDCIEAGYSPLFIPQVADTRIAAPKENRVWQVWYSTPSIRATGRTTTSNARRPSGTPVVVYVHKPNFFSDSKNIREALPKLVNGAGRLPQEEFDAYVGADGQTDAVGNRLVWVIDYDALQKASSSQIKVKSALEHPQTVPFLGGEERAERYLSRHQEVYGSNIGNWHSNDLSDESPLARCLFVGGSSIGLDGDDILYSGRVLGVSAGGATGAKVAPTLENALVAVRPWIGSATEPSVRKALGDLYK